MEKRTVKIPWDCWIPLHTTTINTQSRYRKLDFQCPWQVQYLLHEFALMHYSLSSKSTRPFPGTQASLLLACWCLIEYIIVICNDNEYKYI